MMAFDNIQSTPLTIKDNNVPQFGLQSLSCSQDMMVSIYVEHYKHLQDKLKKLISYRDEIHKEIQRRDAEPFAYPKTQNSLFYNLPPLMMNYESSPLSPLALKSDYTNPTLISADYKEHLKNSTSSFPIIPITQKKEGLKRHLEDLEEIPLEKKIKFECKSESIPVSDAEPEKSERSPHKPQQSKWKNFPGHIMFAIKKGCQNFFDQEKGIRLACIHKILAEEEEYQHKFLQFIEKYKGVWKTYRTIIQYVKDDGDDKIYAMLKRMISELLLEENNKDFEEWLEETRMTEKTKQAIQKGKDVIRKEFLSRLI